VTSYIAEIRELIESGCRSRGHVKL